jgi:ribonuclease HI
MAKKKFYVVWEGRNVGIFETWDECKESIHGFAGAKYKSFQTLELAKQAYSEEYDDYKGKKIFESELSEEELKLIGTPILKSISVDAACSGNPGLMEYQGVETETKKVIFKQGPFKEASNNMGEFLALVHALAYMKKAMINVQFILIVK